jgi:hypothetical protein
MPTDVTKTLRKALAELQAEKVRVEKQIAAIQGVLAVSGPRAGKEVRVVPGKKRGRKAMNAAQRKAVAKRMKAYWAKRKAEAGKGKAEGEK